MIAMFKAVLLSQAVGVDVVTITNQEMCDRTIKKSECEQPAVAAEAGITGNVVLMIEVDKDGQTASIKIIRGHPLLQRPAYECAKQWKFLATGEKYKGEVRVFVGKKIDGK